MRIRLEFIFLPRVASLNLLMDCIKRMLAIGGAEQITFDVIES